VFKAHRLVYHSTLGLGVIKKKRREGAPRQSLQGRAALVSCMAPTPPCRIEQVMGRNPEIQSPGFGFRI